MKKISEIFVLLDDRLGTIAELTRVIKKKNISGMPHWLSDFEFWWIIPVIIGIAIIITGLKMISREDRRI